MTIAILSLALGTTATMIITALALGLALRRLLRFRAALRRIAADPHDLPILDVHGTPAGTLQWAGSIARAALQGLPAPPPLQGPVKLEVAPHCERAAQLLLEVARSGAADHLQGAARLEIVLRLATPLILKEDGAPDPIATAKTAEGEVRALLQAAASEEGFYVGGYPVSDYLITWLPPPGPARVLVALSLPQAPDRARPGIAAAAAALLKEQPGITINGFRILGASPRWTAEDAEDGPAQLRGAAHQLLTLAIQALQAQGRALTLRRRGDAPQRAQLLAAKIADLAARAADLP